MNSMRVMFPYRKNGVWVFDDEAVGLREEPFVMGVPEMIDEVVAGICGANAGFALYFSKSPFPGFQLPPYSSRTQSSLAWATIYARAQSR